MAKASTIQKDKGNVSIQFIRVSLIESIVRKRENTQQIGSVLPYKIDKLEENLQKRK